MHSDHATWICWLFGHGSVLWRVGARGIEWSCPDCHRKRASVLVHLKPGHLK